MEIKIRNAKCELHSGIFLENVNLSINPDEIWAVTGGNGSGKSALGQLIAGKILPQKSENLILPGSAGYISFETHLEAIDREIREDDTDYMDRVDSGRTAFEFICEKTEEQSQAEYYGDLLGIRPLFKKGLKFLSSGEIRKTLICREITSEPELLVLDDPFSGLDKKSVESLEKIAIKLIKSGITPLFLMEREDMIPASVTHVVHMDNMMILFAGKKNEYLEWKKIGATANSSEAKITEDCFCPVGDSGKYSAGDILVDMKKIVVKYDEKQVLNGVDFKVGFGEHWVITGPNGSGKSTLLSLINGDNPKAYMNDITLFGRKRGTGESIWDIKKNIGYVSSELQISYRASATPLTVILSGISDSIGVYRKFSPKEIRSAEKWLNLIGLQEKRNHPYRNLSSGEQRMVLIARAMIKRPPLLILDEPCQCLSDNNSRFVLELADLVGKSGTTTLIYVTHHEKDVVPCITNHLILVPSETEGSSFIKKKTYPGIL